MKNFEKYIDKIFASGYRKDECEIHNLRTKSHDCSYKSCKECIKESRQWLLEEYVESIQLTHDEYVILKNVDKKYKYITRDGKGYELLGLHEHKPERCPTIWFSSENTSLDCYNHLFQFIKWEDEPYEITKLIADYEKENEDE